MATQTRTGVLVDWISSTGYSDLPAAVREKARLALYDGLGSILACSMLPVAHRLNQFVTVSGSGDDCTVIGFPHRTSVHSAALVNGTLGHADEVDPIDDFSTRGSHVFAGCLGAAMTAGQLAGASGHQALRAVVLGYEVSKRVHSVAARVQRETGRSVSPFDEGNTMGAAVAAGAVLGLSRDELDSCLTLAAHLSGGITAWHRETGHMTKSFTRGGIGAQNGVTAALMAKAGYDTPRDIFDGANGFFHSYLGIEDPGPEFVDGLGDDYYFLGLMFKRNSTGAGLQAPRQAIRELMKEHSLTAADIDDVLIGMRPFDINSYFTGQRHPADCGDALAIAIIYPGMGFKEAHQEQHGAGPEVRAMRQRIRVEPREDWVDPRLRWHTLVTITTRDGQSVSKETDYRPMTEEDLDAKFSYLVGLRAGQEKAAELAAVLKNVESATHVGSVMTQLQLPEARIEDL